MANHGLAEFKQRRRDRLAEALDGEFGGNKVAFGERVGINPDHIWQMAKGRGKSARPVSDENATQIEERLGKPAGWLDSSTPSQYGGLDIAKLADLLGTVEAAVAEARIKLPPVVKARLVTTLYADKEASAAASAQAVQAALIGILATMETSYEPDAAR